MSWPTCSGSAARPSTESWPATTAVPSRRCNRKRPRSHRPARRPDWHRSGQLAGVEAGNTNLIARGYRLLPAQRRLELAGSVTRIRPTWRSTAAANKGWPTTTPGSAPDTRTWEPGRRQVERGGRSVGRQRRRPTQRRRDAVLGCLCFPLTWALGTSETSLRTNERYAPTAADPVTERTLYDVADVRPACRACRSRQRPAFSRGVRALMDPAAQGVSPRGPRRP